MSTEEKRAVENAEKNRQEENKLEMCEYSIFTYLKDHTAFLVACVSALVATISFCLNYAANQYTSTYLRYWMVDTVYVRANKTEQVYVILFTLLYLATVLFSHKIMIGTAKAFAFYNRLLSALKWYYKDFKSELRAIKRKTRKLVRLNNRVALKCKPTKRKQLCKESEAAAREYVELETTMKEIRSMRYICKTNLVFRVIGSILAMFGITLVGAGLMTSSRGEYRPFVSLFLSGIVVLFDFLVYFVPSYRSSRVKRKKHKETTLAKIKEELGHSDAHQFPIISIVRTGGKELLSNKSLGKMAFSAIAMVLMLASIFAYEGKMDGETKKEFPIYTDETGTYAAVYNNGDELVLKAAHTDATRIEIDIRQQKVVPVVGVAYEICTFETVVLIDKDGKN